MTSSTFALRVLTVAALASTACVAMPAAAQDSRAVAVEGEAEQFCTLGNPTQSTGALVNFDTPSGTIFAVTNLTEMDTLTTLAANITLASESMCNGIHRIAVASDNNGLWRTGGSIAPAGFASAVPYQANIVWADQEYLITADAGSRRAIEEEFLIGRPAAGNLLIEFSINAGATNAGVGAPLLAGEYSDVLRITVEPQ